MIFGCGYLGTALARRLIEAGIRVGALTRNPQQAERLRDMGVGEVIEGLLHEDDWQRQVKASYEGVVNCVSSAGGGLEGYRQSYLEGQQRIIEWTEGKAIQAYVYTGSTSVYPQDDGAWIDETADTAEAPPTGQILLQSEASLANCGTVTRWYVLRLAGIYGPGRHYLLDQVRRGEEVIPGRGDYFMNMIHRDDAVAAIEQALCGEAASGVYNIADGAPETKAKVLAYLAAQLGQPAPRFDPSQVPGRLKRRGGRMPSRKIDNRKALEALGWELRHPSFREGYRTILGKA